MTEHEVGENKHLYYTKNRLFINSVLGCASNCHYCYLDDIGLAKGKILTKIDSNKIIASLEQYKSSFLQPNRVIVSFGCYSDPWAKISRQDTIEIIKYLDKDNYKMTISTKQYIDVSDLENLRQINKSNLVFLVSMPITKELSNYEKGTSSIRLRIRSIENLKNLGFKVAIYVKPFIPNVTIQGLPIIKGIMENYEVPIVLGKLFTVNGAGELAVVSKSVELYEHECEEYLMMKNYLQEFGIVYEHSYEVFETI
ncbi:Spore photoproduct lyase [uncultured bacterium]|nr:Spore photoproduct lyase [uncultured bacterium]